MLDYTIEIMSEFRASTIAGGFTRCEHMYSVSAPSLAAFRDIDTVENMEKHVMKLVHAQGKSVSDLMITFNVYSYKTYATIGICRIYAEYGSGPAWKVVSWPHVNQTDVEKREKITAKDARALYLRAVEKIEEYTDKDSALSA